MGKFNKSKTETRNEKMTTTHEGGKGYKQSPVIELYSILANGLGHNYYENEKDRLERIKNLLSKIAEDNLELVAKMLVYVRSQVGQRSSTHYTSAVLARYMSGSPLGKRFYSKRNRGNNEGGVVYRLDDMLEIMGAYYMENGSDAPLPNSMKNGFRRALENADRYELAKYQAKNRDISLMDVVNYVHPKETSTHGTTVVDKEEYMEAIENSSRRTEEKIITDHGDTVEVPSLDALICGLLKEERTSRSKNTESGKEVAEKVKSGEISEEEAEKELKEKKAKNWAELIRNEDLGYFALLRNLRNIMQDAPEVLDDALDMLTNEKLVRSSLVFPHQIDLALEVISDEFSNTESNKVIKALDEAYRLSVPNLQDSFDGRTAVVIDTSGSMFGGWNSFVYTGDGSKINKDPIEKASLIGATFAKGVGGDLYQFSSRTKAIKYNPMDSINSIKNQVLNLQGEVGHGTMYDTIFKTLDGFYDRIFVISDMQGADNIARNSAYQDYKNSYGRPYIYSIDLTGYGSTMFNPDDQFVHQLFGYGSDIYELAQKVEIDEDALINEIQSIEI